MAKAAKDSMMQANEDKKQIKELQNKLELAAQADTELKKLTENETRLKKQVEDSERVVADLQDEFRILEGQLRYANQQRDVLENELDQAKLT